jgi:tetratricopeptide (TPR) repeat protein
MRGEDDESYAELLADIAYLSYMSGDVNQADGFYRRAIAAFETKGFGSSVGFGLLLQEYGILLKEMQQYRDALDYFFKTEDIFSKHWVRDSDVIWFVELQLEIADAYVELNQYDLALNLYENAKKILEESCETQNILYVFILNNLGEVLLELKRNIEALPLFEEALNLAEHALLDSDCVIAIKNNLLKAKRVNNESDAINR